MEILLPSLRALLQVTAAGLLLGAGLPALFGLGLRCLGVSGPDGGPAAPPDSLGRIGAFICFALVVVAALFGIVVIVFGKQLFG
ncbi:MAG TPA: hypothetical protein VD962_05610 [Rubricoccaceae bacterium]|nr:hypothetical protein [Rubricoccaceae bacterium]